MDQKLLDALNNLSQSLDLISQILSEKKAVSPTAKSLEGGNINTQFKQISSSLKRIEADNKKILKNQQTILGISKQKESEKKQGVFEKAGDKNTQSLIKSGASIILLIAVAVLAIGMAFKLVGNVNFLSVVGLSLAIVLMSIAFEKVAKLKLSKSDAFNTSLIMVMMAGAITTSSWILSLIKPIGIDQGLTAILISGTFTVISYGLKNILTALKGINLVKAAQDAAVLPIIFLSLMTSLVASSWIMSLIKPISFGQGLTAILIAGTFAVISYGLKNILKALKGVDESSAIAAAFIMPILFTGMSIAIMSSSLLLSNISPMTLGQSLTSILISVLFISFSMSAYLILKALKGISTSDVVKASIMMPLLFTAMSASIMASSWLLSKATPIPFGNLLSLLAMSVVVSVAAVAMGTAAWVLSKIGLENIIEGGVAIIAISTTIMLSSLILNLGSYDKYPTLQWALGVGLSLAAFGLGAVLLGTQVLNPFFYGGLGAILLVAGTILATDAILSNGKFDINKFPSDKWILGVGTTLLKIAMISVGIGFLLPLILLGSAAILTVGYTINKIDKLLSSGEFKKYPSKDWVDGVAGSIAGFVKIMDNTSFLSVLGGKLKSLFGGGIDDVVDGMVKIAQKLTKSGDIWNTRIDPNFMNSLSSNIKKYTELSNFVNDNSPNGGISGIVKSVVGGSSDPMDMVISGMIKLGDAYTKLSKSIQNFGNSINGIDVDKLSAIKSLTSNIVLMSLMDPDSFESMLKKLEDKAGLFVNIVKDINDATENGGKVNTPAINSKSSNPDPVQQQILGVLSSMDSKLSVIASNSTTLADYTHELRAGQGVKIKR